MILTDVLGENDAGSAKETDGLDPDEWDGVMIGPAKGRDLLSSLTRDVGSNNHGEPREEGRVLGQE